MGWRSGQWIGLMIYLMNIGFLGNMTDRIMIGKYKFNEGLHVLVCSLLLGVELRQPGKTSE